MGDYRYIHLPRSVIYVLRAECTDYERRRAAIRSIDTPEDVADAHRRRNEAIDDALCSIELPLRSAILSDIIFARGYDKSPAAMITSKSLYYSRKHTVMETLAKNLMLI